MMKTMVINSNFDAKLATTDIIIRQMYNLLGSNMTQIINDSKLNWQSAEEFNKWKQNVFLSDNDTQHILVFDSRGLRGFISYTAKNESSEIYLNEVQIRYSKQGDGVTIRYLFEEFMDCVKDLPITSIRTYCNRRNARAQCIIEKAGFRKESKTDRGYRYTIDRKTLPKLFSKKKNKNGIGH